MIVYQKHPRAYKVLQYARAGKLCWSLITESSPEQFLGKEHFAWLPRSVGTCTEFDQFNTPTNLLNVANAEFCKGGTFSSSGRQAYSGPMSTGKMRPKAVFSGFCCNLLCEYLCKWCCIILCAYVRPDTYLCLCNTPSSFNMESKQQLHEYVLLFLISWH